MTFTWQDLGTAIGSGAVATLALVLVQVLKAGVPAIFDRITGGTMAFVVTAVVYIIGAVVLQPLNANETLALFIAWVFCAVAALGLHGIANNGAATFVQGAPKDSGPPPK